MFDKFTFFADFAQIIKETLPAQEQAAAFQAICEYGIYGTLPSNPLLKGMCLMINARIRKGDGRSKNGGNHNPDGINQHSKEVNSVNLGQSGQFGQSGQSLEQKEEKKAPQEIPPTTPKEIPQENNKNNIKNTPSLCSGVQKKGCRFENSAFCGENVPETFALEAQKMNKSAIAQAEYDRFRDYWTAKTGQSATKLDWLATWRNWLRDTKGGGSLPTGNDLSPVAPDAGRHHSREEMEAFLGRKMEWYNGKRVEQ